LPKCDPFGEASVITVVLGLTAGWLLIAAFALSLTRAARRGDRPADLYAKERSLPPPPAEAADYPSHGQHDGPSHGHRYITDPLPEEPAVQQLALPDDS